MKSAIALISLFCCLPLMAATLETKPNDPFFAKFKPLKAPKSHGPLLKHGDHLAICGDSITEQRKYSRIIETYLTVALPEWNISTRQYGWSGEQVPGFVARMTNDVLRFKPDIATTCYGMNDHHYQPYQDSIGAAYRSNSTAMVEAFKSIGTRVVLGSPGCMGEKTAWGWVKGTPEERNLNLCALRNIDVELAQSEHVGFADVFWPMYQAGFDARKKYGEDYALSGGDSVHPDWAGHLVMAYSYLKALGVPGDIGVFTVNLKSNKAEVSKGHEMVSCKDGVITIKSSRYPFCASGPADKNNSIHSGMTLVPFNAKFNRLMLKVKGASGKNCKVTWGDESKVFTTAQLEHGVNLADEFESNPFSAAFAAVDEAVAKKQEFETRQVKELFHHAKDAADLDQVVAETERERAPLVAAIHSAFVPVTHTITITPAD